MLTFSSTQEVDPRTALLFPFCPASSVCPTATQRPSGANGGLALPRPGTPPLCSVFAPTKTLNVRNEQSQSARELQKARESVRNEAREEEQNKEELRGGRLTHRFLTTSSCI